MLSGFLATVQAPAMHTPAPVVFYVRPLLWDELRKSVNPSEINELFHVLGRRYVMGLWGYSVTLSAQEFRGGTGDKK